ncbi:MAG: HAD-IA family hydrolase [Micropruina sp.]|uniref:HAD-IA family hydrolase n=1 Tax=Micropruina sp. TaxID=2737536 RepID=UPI0039E4C29C
MSLTAVQLVQDVPTSPDAAWQLLTDHPELLWGHQAPDLVAGARYASVGHGGAGGAGTIQDVADGVVRFSWTEDTWAEPADPVLTLTEGAAGTTATLTIEGAPDGQAESLQQQWSRMLGEFAGFAASRNPVTDQPVRAVLFDADGVLQSPRGDWLARFAALGGPGFVKAAFTAELDCLTGKVDLADRLEPLLAGRDGTVTDVLAVWHDIDLDADAFAVVDRVRDAGLTCCLATNQQSRRGGFMQEHTDTNSHFDRVYYSYQVGHAKPSAAFFQAIVDDLQLPIEQIAFVDDAPANVIAARELGLRAVLHRQSTGADGLARDLRSIGVPV